MQIILKTFNFNTPSPNYIKEEDKSWSEINSNIEFRKVENNVELHQFEKGNIQISIGKFKNRRMFNQSFKDILWSFFCLYKWKSQKKKWALMRKRDKQFSLGVDKFNFELDWISIINSFRELKVLIQLLMNENQRQVVRFNRSNVLKLTLDKYKDIDSKICSTYRNTIDFPHQNDKNSNISQFHSKIDSLFNEISNDQDKDFNKRLIDIIK